MQNEGEVLYSNLETDDGFGKGGVDESRMNGWIMIMVWRARGEGGASLSRTRCEGCMGGSGGWLSDVVRAHERASDVCYFTVLCWWGCRLIAPRSRVAQRVALQQSRRFEFVQLERVIDHPNFIFLVNLSWRQFLGSANRPMSYG